MLVILSVTSSPWHTLLSLFGFEIFLTKGNVIPALLFFLNVKYWISRCYDTRKDIWLNLWKFFLGNKTLVHWASHVVLWKIKSTTMRLILRLEVVFRIFVPRCVRCQNLRSLDSWWMRNLTLVLVMLCFAAFLFWVISFQLWISISIWWLIHRTETHIFLIFWI